jgi:hypothetical protein
VHLLIVDLFPPQSPRSLGNSQGHLGPRARRAVCAALAQITSGRFPFLLSDRKRFRAKPVRTSFFVEASSFPDKEKLDTALIPCITRKLDCLETRIVRTQGTRTRPLPVRHPSANPVERLHAHTQRLPKPSLHCRCQGLAP